MKIKCISNKASFFKKQKYDVEYDLLKIGKEYNVYGMIVDSGEIWYYICDTDQALFPLARPQSLFEILDHRLSRYWIFGFIEGFEKYPIWIFPEWITEPYFEDNLTDWKEREVRIFNSYKELIDLEFPDSSILESAQICDNEWLLCPICIDAWKYSSSKNGLVRCPKCKKFFKNPRYENERFLS